uniref:Uncharacterized protein n=1 Tax=Ditylenchus dipsaci TaxID=166011 RepID=A0A915EIG4_9BILA
MVETLSKLDSENIKKEEFIRHQTMSGEEARTLIVKRKTLKEQLNSARDQNYEADKKKSELEPRFYKKSAELRFEYKAFLTSLQDFCSSFHSLNNVQGIKWSEYEYDAASQEFINSPRNKLTELIDMLKKETERITRTLEDTARDLQSAKQDLEFIQAKRRSVKEEEQEQSNLVVQWKAKQWDVENKYLEQKKSLEKVYNDVLAATYDKIAKLYTKFNEIMKCKEELKDLGEHILAE